MTEKTIQKALLYAFSSHIYKFTNVYFFNNESDWLSFLQSGFCYEVEIKISRSDFKADFKKEKHLVHNCNNQNSKYFVRRLGSEIKRDPTWDFCREFPELITATEREDYSRRDYRDLEWQEVKKIDLQAVISSRIEFVEQKNTQLPNKFFYAVPAGLISKEEVPDYAGLLYIDENQKVTKIKDGKFLHKDKHQLEKLFTKMYYSYERELFNKLK